MALTNTDRKVIHAGNASATVFPYTFPILSASHLSVIYTNAAGAETTLSPSQFSVTGIGGRSGGSVTYPLAGSPIATGTKLTIVRTVPYTQTTVLSNQGGYYPEVVEARFDLLTMAMQQLAEIVSRYTVSSISNPATEQSNYALIQALQATIGGLDKLTTQGDLLTRDVSGYKRLARGTAGQFLGITGADPTWAVPQVDLAGANVSGVLPRANGGFTPAPAEYAMVSNVALNNTASWIAGPTLTLGTGVWFVFGGVTINAAASGARVGVRLTDGTNIKDSRSSTWASAVTPAILSFGLAGTFTNPGAAVRIEGNNADSTGGGFVYNQTGMGRDCTLTAIRIG